jgi:uncharacterized repeat protein (TIGR03803 family)
MMHKGSVRPNWVTGLAFALVILAGRQSTQAQTFTALYNFTGGSDGGYPEAGVIRDKQGNLYGTTVYSGDLSCVNDNGGNQPGCGVVFRLDTIGNETVLHTFIGADGALPEAPVIRDAKGNLYGDTCRGGTYGWGTVFKVDTSGNETVLHSFNTIGDGWGNTGGLLLDKGNLYGYTYNGGAYGYGTVFELDGGTETLLFNFNFSDGAYPYLTNAFMDKEGNLYGTTYAGGAYGYGTVFELSTSGQETVLHSFAGGTTDGCNPIGTPAMDNEGNFYGTTNSCGSSNLGTVWKLSKNGTETLLHSFAGSDGAYPYAGVLRERGNLYGTTGAGGIYNFGTLFELNKKGVLTVLHSFTGADGSDPGSLLKDKQGNLYGTADSGGTYGYGTVFELTP